MRSYKHIIFIAAGLLLHSAIVQAAILPEDRADVLFHSYEGGGVEITGPSILVRKQIGDSFSASANFYVDSVTSASIDVVASASPYTEERTETSLSLEYLRDKVTLSAAYTNSDENDFLAKSLNTDPVSTDDPVFHEAERQVTDRLDDVYSARPSELDADLAELQALAIDEDW